MLACRGIFAKCYIAQAERQLGWDVVPKDLSHKSLLRTLYHKIPILSRVFSNKSSIFFKIHIITPVFCKPVYKKAVHLPKCFLKHFFKFIRVFRVGVRKPEGI